MTALIYVEAAMAEGSGGVKGSAIQGKAVSGQSRLTIGLAGQGAQVRIGHKSAPVERSLPLAAESVSLSAMSSVEDDDEGGRGGGTSFGELYRGHWTNLCHYIARNFGAGPPDPEDIAQQAFERLLGSASIVENVGPFLRRTARNLVIDHYRASLRTATVMTSMSILEADHNDLSPEDVLSSKRELMNLNGVIAKLPARERIALLMHRVDGASFVEIAAHLGVSHSGARLLVARAFERCAGAMEQQP